MSRLVVVSNRVPSPTDGQCSGGLAVALKAALEERGGIWLGWSGQLVSNPVARAEQVPVNGFGLATIDLSEREFEGYYTQCANRCLWPLLHSRIELACFSRHDYALYRKVNRRFAQALSGLLGPDDVIWIHDYHLIPLGAELRRLGVAAPLGFFLHTPFPAPDILSALPWHDELLEHFHAYDLVGFQTSESHQNFLDAAERLMRGADRAARRGRAMASGSYPISIDTAQFVALAASAEAKRWCRQFETLKGNLSWAVGVERLDYTKGLPERFLAFETLLEQAPGFRHRLSLVQVAAPSRETVTEYHELQRQLEALSGRINAQLGGLHWAPICYLNRAFNHTQLAALFRVARIGVVTPLRDGMNLVAKEYVAAQDPENPGVLVLSRFAGAAEELRDALLVNPYDIEGTAATLRRALEMRIEERKERWTGMMRHLEQNDVHHWRRRFLGDLAPRSTRVPMLGTAPRDAA